MFQKRDKIQNNDTTKLMATESWLKKDSNGITEIIGKKKAQVIWPKIKLILKRQILLDWSATNCTDFDYYHYNHF